MCHSINAIYEFKLHKMMKHFLILTVALISSMVFSQEYYSGNTFGGGGLDIQYNSALDSQGNIYSVGLYQTSMTVGSSTIATNGGNADGFLTKHDNQGNPIWVKSFGGANDDVAIDIAIDSNDNIYLTGYFQGAGPNSFDANPANVDDDGNPNTSNADEFWLAVTSFLNSRDCFIIKLDSNGDFLWAKQISNSVGATNEDSNTIEVDSQGNVYIAGSFVYADFDPDPAVNNDVFANGDGANGTDPFLLKLDADGNFVWVKTYDCSDNAKILDMEFDANDNLYVTGQFVGIIDLDSSANTDSYTSEGGFDNFIMKLDANQDYVWGGSYGSLTNDTPNTIKVYDSSIYVGGYFTGSTDFDLGSGSTMVSPAGQFDGYVVKYNTDGNIQFVYTIGSADSGVEEVESIREVNDVVYISGQFIGTADFDNGSGTASSSSAGGTDAYMVEVSSSGDYINHVTLGGSFDEDFTHMEIQNDEILLYGSFESDPMDLNPFAGEDNFTGAVSKNCYLSRFATTSLLSVDDFNPINNISVYPNPANNILNITLNSLVFNSFKIYSVTGQTILKGELVSGQSYLDISDLSTGLYMLNLSGVQSSQTIRFIKE